MLGFGVVWRSSCVTGGSTLRSNEKGKAQIFSEALCR